MNAPLQRAIAQVDHEARLKQQLDQLDNDIADTIRKIYSPMQRQASDAATFVALALFIASAATIAALYLDMGGP